MPTLFEALSDGSYDLQNRRDLSSNFSRNLLTYRNEVVNNYIKFHTDLSKSIANIARKHNLNKDQISRIIEESNNQVYLIEYDKLKNSMDRDVEFTIATMNSVMNYMNKKNDNNDKTEFSKKSFEEEKFSLEKVASYSEKAKNPFSGIYGNKLGDLSVPSKTKSEILLTKIAECLNDKENKLEKISEEINAKAIEISESLVNCEKINHSANKVFNILATEANFDESESDFIKTATEDCVNRFIKQRKLPKGFSVKIEKIAVENKISLGKFSLIEKTAAEVPRVCLSSNRQIRNFDDLLKIATEFHELKADFLKLNNEIVCAKEKLAAENINFQQAN